MNPYLALAIVLGLAVGFALRDAWRLHKVSLTTGQIAWKVAIYPAVAVAYAIAAPMFHPGLYG